MKTSWMGGLAAMGATILLGLSGCSASSLIPDAKADPTRFYILSGPADAAVAGGDANAPTVRVRGVEVANYLRARPIVVRRGGNEVQFRDFARWGEPLEDGIARVLREGLLAAGAGEVRLASTRGAVTDATYDLRVRILACEGDADGGVNFRAAWELRRGAATAEGATARHGEFRASGVTWNGRDEATLAAALSQAVQGLAAEIAAAMKE